MVATAPALAGGINLASRSQWPMRIAASGEARARTADAETADTETTAAGAAVAAESDRGPA